MNIWFWLLILLPPLVVLPIKPQTSSWFKTILLTLIFCLAYLFLNLALHLNIDRKWNAYTTCCAEKGLVDRCELDIYIKPKRICPPARNSGAPEAFYLFFGWIAAAGYVGIWELLRRIYYKLIIHQKNNRKEMYIIIGILVFVAATLYPTWLFIHPLFTVIGGM